MIPCKEEPIDDQSGYYPGGGTVTVADFLRGEDLIAPALFMFGRPVSDDSQEPGTDLGAALRNPEAIDSVDVSIGQQMTRKLLGITELDATDFSTVV